MKKYCPVSGKEIDVTTRTPMVEADGEIYHFCSRGHREMFMSNPRHFLSEQHLVKEVHEPYPEYMDLSEPEAPTVQIHENLQIGSVTVAVQVLTHIGAGEPAGQITIEDTGLGLMFTPQVSYKPLAGGLRGFHVHQYGDLGPAMKDGKLVIGLAAGSHYDPKGTGSHQGPYGNGHLGDLPPLYFDVDGNADIPVLAPRLKLQDVYGRALIIHSGGDNFTDDPPNGGGENRVLGSIIR